MCVPCRSLRHKGFKMVERGEIEVKGKGQMRTYFLERNLTATESQIMGYRPREASPGREGAEGGEARLYTPAVPGERLCSVPVQITALPAFLY